MFKPLRTVGLLALATFAFAATTQETVTLRRVLQEGQKDVYVMATSMTNEVDASAFGGGKQEVSVDTSMTMTYAVGKLDEATKKADITIQVDDLKLDMGGMAGMMAGGEDTPKSYKLTGKIDERNLISDVKVEGLPKAMAMFLGGSEGIAANLNFMVFPDQALAVGESWDMKLPKSKIYGDQEVKVKAKILGLAKVGGMDAVEVEITGQVPMHMDMSEAMKDMESASPVPKMVMSGKMDMTSKVTLERSSGRILIWTTKANSDIELDMVDMGVKMPMTGTTTSTMKLKSLVDEK